MRGMSSLDPDRIPKGEDKDVRKEYDPLGKLGTVVPSHIKDGGSEHALGSYGIATNEARPFREVDIETGAVMEAAEAGPVILDPTQTAAPAVEAPAQETSQIEDLSQAMAAVSAMVREATASTDTVQVATPAVAQLPADAPAPSEATPDVAESVVMQTVVPVVAAPTEDVEFSGDFGSITASYHEVIVEDMCLVLMFDRRCRTHHYYKPPARNDRRVELDVEIRNGVYQGKYHALSAGVSFDIASKNLAVTVLLIATSEASNGEDR